MEKDWGLAPDAQPATLDVNEGWGLPLDKTRGWRQRMWLVAFKSGWEVLRFGMV